MVNLDFLKDFQKELKDVEGIGADSEPPRYWITTGNYVLNKIMSGSFFQGIPQGRVTGLAGPSGTGKSFLAGNFAKHAQDAGAFVLVVDSENALDDDFMRRIGVNVDDKSMYDYKSVTTVANAISVISAFLKGYKKEFGTDGAAPKVLIVIDSLDMMMTETELEHYGKGDQAGDQGQRAKQLKAFLRSMVQDIKKLNVSVVVTCQTYVAKQDQILAGEGTQIVNSAVRFSLSQIIMLSKLKLKDTGSSVVKGIRMKCEGFKTRFTQPFQTVTIEVPYTSGMDPLSGLLDTAVDLGVVVKAGSRYKLNGSDDSWYSKDMAQHAQTILIKAEGLKDAYLEAKVADDDVEPAEKVSMAAKREEKAKDVKVG